MSRRRKLLAIHEDLLNKHEREGYGPKGPQKPKVAPQRARPQVDAGLKRDRTVAPAATPVNKIESLEAVVYLVSRGKQGWSVSEASLPTHVIESYDFKHVAGPSSVDLAMARLCERIELRAYTSGK